MHVIRTSAGLNSAALAGAIVLGLLAGGCGRDSSPGGANPPAGPTNPTATEMAIPQGFVLFQAPEGAVSVAEAKASAKAGDTVTVRARVGGTKAPFTDDRAIMIVADTEKIKSCADSDEDHCPTPWDYCCESKEDLTAYTASIKVIGDNGALVRRSLEGVGGLKALDTVIIVGSVGERPSPGLLEITASNLYIEKN